MRTVRVLLLGSVLSWAAALSVSSAPLTWFPGPSLGTPMSGCAAVVNHGNNILAGGDANEFYDYPLTEIISLAATNNYWAYVSSYYALNIAGGAVVSDGNVVVYGGTDGTNSQDITIAVSLSGDTTPAMPSMKVARSYLGYAPDKNANAYAFGGLDANGNALASAEKLNPTANTPAWNYITAMPGPRYSFPAVFNRTNYIYIVGGLTNPATGMETASVLRYSVSGNSWSNMAPMLVAVAGSAATLGPDGKIYVAGGTSGGVATDIVQVYDPAANSWSLSTPLPEALSLAAMGVDSLNRLIVMGGVDADGNDVADVWRSQPFGVPDSPPVFTSLPATNGVYLAAYSSSVSAIGSPAPTYSLISGPAGMSVDHYSGAIAWTPQGLNQIGVAPVSVQAANYAGTTNYSFTITVPNPPPAAPTNVTVVGITESSVSFAWGPEDPVAGAVTYSVWLRHVIHDPRGSGETIWYSQIGSSTTDTNITIGGLAAGLSQAYYVKATGPGGTSGYSVASATTLSAPPPTNLRVTGLTSTSITLEWDAPVGGFPISSYRILGWFDGIAAQYPLSYSNIQGTRVTLTGLAPGGAMLWGVAALDTAGNVTSYDYLSSLVVNPTPQRATLGAVVVPQASGGFQFTVQVGTAQTILIQATSTLADPNSWQTIATNPPAATSFTFTDPNSSQFSMRFYRAVCP